MSDLKLSIVPMAPELVPAYFRGLVDWYAEALDEHGCGDVDEMHAAASRYYAPYLDAGGLPKDSAVFDILVEGEQGPVGATWCGGADFGSGPTQFIHDLRIFPPFRRRGYGREALDTIVHFARKGGHLRGVALSVLARNAGAAALYASEGFVPLSQVLIKSF